MAPGSEALDPACVLCIHMGLRARSDEVPAGDAAKLAPRLKELSCGPLRSTLNLCQTVCCSLNRLEAGGGGLLLVILPAYRMGEWEFVQRDWAVPVAQSHLALPS